MQIVIDIPKEMYEQIKLGKDGYSNYVHTAVRNGTPLPSNHGRLIDVERLYDDYESMDYDFEDAIEYAPTIIEADRSDEE